MVRETWSPNLSFCPFLVSSIRQEMSMQYHWLLSNRSFRPNSLQYLSSLRLGLPMLFLQWQREEKRKTRGAKSEEERKWDLAFSWVCRFDLALALSAGFRGSLARSFNKIPNRRYTNIFPSFATIPSLEEKKNHRICKWRRRLQLAPRAFPPSWRDNTEKKWLLTELRDWTYFGRKKSAWFFVVARATIADFRGTSCY